MNSNSFILSKNEIHVWRVSIIKHQRNQKGLEAVLSNSEKQRVSQFRFEKDRSMYAISHGTLRELIARYLSTDAVALEFNINSFGKPYLEKTPLRFNISHSMDVALIAITKDVEIGVDVEMLDTKTDCLTLAKRFFAKCEYEAILSAPEANRVPSFYRLWTGKEAIIKARGKGLSIPLDSFSIVPYIQGSETLNPQSNLGESSIWTLSSLEVVPPYVASLAYEGKERTVLARDW